eukprot:2786328-Prymnesium_polylepis.1
MGNNLWSAKFPAFAKLDATRRKKYWSKIFNAYKSMCTRRARAASTRVYGTQIGGLWPMMRPGA